MAGALGWVRGQLGWASDVRLRRRLAGATSSSLYEVEASDAQRTRRFVLRLIDNAKWLAECPEIARQEAEALERAASSSIAVPELVGVDQTGEACGHPAVLMSYLEGSINLSPIDLDRYIESLAETLAEIHAIEPARFNWEYDPWFDIREVRPPQWSTHPKEWERAITVVATVDGSVERSFLHRDYHPVNVLWESGRISGVVDWPNACVGPRAVDLAHCRLNLVALFGVEAADRFLAAYLRIAEPVLNYDPIHDLVALLETASEPLVYRPWLEFGVALTEDEVRERREVLLLSALAKRAG